VLAWTNPPSRQPLNSESQTKEIKDIDNIRPFYHSTRVLVDYK